MRVHVLTFELQEKKLFTVNFFCALPNFLREEFSTLFFFLSMFSDVGLLNKCGSPGDVGRDFLDDIFFVGRVEALTNREPEYTPEYTTFDFFQIVNGSI